MSTLTDKWRSKSTVLTHSDSSQTPNWWHLRKADVEAQLVEACFQARFSISHWPGKLIVIEGIDGSGKTTLVEALKARLMKSGKEVSTYRFPSNSLRESHMFKQFVQSRAHGPLTPLAQEVCYMSDRIQQAQSVLLPDLHAGKWVICDRYVYSSLGALITHAPNQFNAAINAAAGQSWFVDLTHSLPSPDAAYVVVCARKVVERRLHERGELNAIGSGRHYDMLVRIFQAIAQRNDMTLIDTTRMSPSQSLSSVWHSLCNSFPELCIP